MRAKARVETCPTCRPVPENSKGRLIQTNEIALRRLKPILVNDPIENGPRLEGRRQGVNRENEKLCASGVDNAVPGDSARGSSVRFVCAVH
jgi:hypothetical protein